MLILVELKVTKDQTFRAVIRARQEQHALHIAQRFYGGDILTWLDQATTAVVTEEGAFGVILHD